MSNREIEAILKISSKLGNMQALKTLQDKLKAVDAQAKAFNRSQMAITKGVDATMMAVSRYVAPAAAVYGVVKSFTAFADVERRLERIGITAGATAEQTAAALGQLQNFAQQFALPIDSVATALEELVAGGMNLKEAMAFLPAVLATAQASGAETADIAKTAQSASVALGISAGEMQKAFDLMVAGGKAGKFELKDMAQEIPRLAGLFSSAGYKGTDGLKTMIATLQTLRQVTADGGTAATQLQDIMIKMNTQETAKRFEKFGIDLPAALAKAKQEGKDLLQTFVELSKQATGGDLSKLPLLFGDKELLLGMQTLMTSADAWNKFFKALDNVDGEAARDLARILSGSAADIERMGSAWEQFKTSLGSTVAPAITPVLETLANNMTKDAAARKSMADAGVPFMERQFMVYDDPERYAEYARRGGWVDPTDPAAVRAAREAPDAYKVLGRMPRRPITPMPTRDAPQMPAPGRSHRELENQSMMDMARQGNDLADAIAAGAERAGSTLKDNVTEGGDGAGATIAEQIKSAMATAGDALAAKILSAVSSIKINVGGVPGGVSRPTGDPGVSGGDIMAVP